MLWMGFPALMLVSLSSNGLETGPVFSCIACVSVSTPLLTLLALMDLLTSHW